MGALIYSLRGEGDSHLYMFSVSVDGKLIVAKGTDSDQFGIWDIRTSMR